MCWVQESSSLSLALVSRAVARLTPCLARAPTPAPPAVGGARRAWPWPPPGACLGGPVSRSGVLCCVVECCASCVVWVWRRTRRACARVRGYKL